MSKFAYFFHAVCALFMLMASGCSSYRGPDLGDFSAERAVSLAKSRLLTEGKKYNKGGIYNAGDAFLNWAPTNRRASYVWKEIDCMYGVMCKYELTKVRSNCSANLEVISNFFIEGESSVLSTTRGIKKMSLNRQALMNLFWIGECLNGLAHGQGVVGMIYTDHNNRNLKPRNDEFFDRAIVTMVRGNVVGDVFFVREGYSSVSNSVSFSIDGLVGSINGGVVENKFLAQNDRDFQGLKSAEEKAFGVIAEMVSPIVKEVFKSSGGGVDSSARQNKIIGDKFTEGGKRREVWGWCANGREFSGTKWHNDNYWTMRGNNKGAIQPSNISLEGVIEMVCN